MTIDRESLRPAFERAFPVPDGVHWDSAASKYRSQSLPVDCAIQQSFWEGFCAAFESLGEPVGYVDAGALTALHGFRANCYHGYVPSSIALSAGKHGQDFPVPLYRIPEVKA